MPRVRSTLLVVVAGLALWAGTASAQRAPNQGLNNNTNNNNNNQNNGQSNGGGTSVPELDPRAAGAMAALLAGGVLLLVGRRR